MSILFPNYWFLTINYQITCSSGSNNFSTDILSHTCSTVGLLSQSIMKPMYIKIMDIFETRWSRLDLCIKECIIAMFKHYTLIHTIPSQWCHWWLVDFLVCAVQHLCGRVFLKNKQNTIKYGILSIRVSSIADDNRG